MSVLALILAMAMSVATAGAPIARPPCSAQLRAGTMCSVAGLPGQAAEPVKKPGVCLLCLIPGDEAKTPDGPESRLVLLPRFPCHDPAHVHITGPGQAKVNLTGRDGRPELVSSAGIKHPTCGG